MHIQCIVLWSNTLYHAYKWLWLSLKLMEGMWFADTQRLKATITLYELCTQLQDANDHMPTEILLRLVHAYIRNYSCPATYNWFGYFKNKSLYMVLKTFLGFVYMYAQINARVICICLGSFIGKGSSWSQHNFLHHCS